MLGSLARFPLLVLALLLLPVSLAQEPGAEFEADLTQALQALADATSYHFTYRMAPNVDATTQITGEGMRDKTANSWRYTIASDPSDPKVDHSQNGDWLIVDGVHYHNAGSGWTTGGINFTNSGITSALAPFESYGTLKQLSSGDNFRPLEHHGLDDQHGVPADHYSFATIDMPMYGTAQFDIWIAKDGDDVGFVAVGVTPDGKPMNVVTYSHLNEPVAIEAPN